MVKPSNCCIYPSPVLSSNWHARILLEAGRAVHNMHDYISYRPSYGVESQCYPGSFQCIGAPLACGFGVSWL